MRLEILCFGKLKTPGTRELADYYLKLLRPWAETRERELKPLTVDDKSRATRDRVRAEEARMIQDALAGPDYKNLRALVFLDEIGKAQPTAAWADALREWESGAAAKDPVVFVIGGSLGLDPGLKGLRWCLGPQTLSHELARVVCLEQLYRAMSVVRGHPYHNA